MLILALATVAAGLLAWQVYRYEVARLPALTACARLTYATTSSDQTQAQDELLKRLLPERARCAGDAIYIDAVVSLLLPLQRFEEARQLLAEANQRHTFTEPEREALLARIELAEAHGHWAADDLPTATVIHQRARSVAEQLQRQWPEWTVPYSLLAEAERADWATPRPTPPADWYRVQVARRWNLSTGAFLRAFEERPFALLVFLGTLVVLLGMSVAFGAHLEQRYLLGLKPRPIGDATPGPITVLGSLHLLPSDSALQGPLSKVPVVCWETQQSSLLQRTATTIQRSQQAFLLRDATGEAIIAPAELTVRSRHRAQTPGGTRLAKRRSTFEIHLREGDIATVAGELQLKAAPDGRTLRTIVRPVDGGRLLVSNLSLETLVAIERRWLGCAVTVSILAFGFLGWAFQQRYLVRAIPGVLT